MGKDNLFSKEDILETPEDVFEKDKSYRKKVNGCRKGKTFERATCDDLAKRFGGVFRRVPTSGAMVGGMNRFRNADINEAAKQTLTGDIICPTSFPFSVECKNYYDSPKLHNLLSIGDKELDGWISQAKGESEFVKKDWIIIFKITTLRGKTFVTLDKKRFLSLHEIFTDAHIRYKGTIILDYDLFFEKYIGAYFEAYKKADPIPANVV
jgi:hypothetical protein